MASQKSKMTESEISVEPSNTTTSLVGDLHVETNSETPSSSTKGWGLQAAKSANHNLRNPTQDEATANVDCKRSPRLQVPSRKGVCHLKMPPADKGLALCTKFLRQTHALTIGSVVRANK